MPDNSDLFFEAKEAFRDYCRDGKKKHIKRSWKFISKVPGMLSKHSKEEYFKWAEEQLSVCGFKSKDPRVLEELCLKH